MAQFSFLTSALLMATLGGCALGTQEATRLDAPMLHVQQQDVDAAEIADQAAALNRMAGDLVRRSTLKGAATGALVGCGLVVVSSSNGKNCVAAAAAGGLAGAAIGRAKGQREVDARVELVSANALVRSIRGMNGQMEALELSLPELLSEQDAELADLKMRQDTGAITSGEYEAGVAAIRQSRAQIAEALTSTIARAETAHGNLEEASQRGQTGLDWHLGATSSLAREATSARSTISLL